MNYPMYICFLRFRKIYIHFFYELFVLHDFIHKMSICSSTVKIYTKKKTRKYYLWYNYKLNNSYVFRQSQNKIWKNKKSLKNAWIWDRRETGACYHILNIHWQNRFVSKKGRQTHRKNWVKPRNMCHNHNRGGKKI